MAKTSKNELFRQNDWYWAEGFKKKVSKKVGSFSKFGCFFMAPDKAIKHPNLLKQPTFFETFLKKPSAQHQSFCLKSLFLLVSAQRIVYQEVMLISGIWDYYGEFC